MLVCSWLRADRPGVLPHILHPGWVAFAPPVHKTLPSPIRCQCCMCARQRSLQLTSRALGPKAVPRPVTRDDSGSHAGPRCHIFGRTKATLGIPAFQQAGHQRVVHGCPIGILPEACTSFNLFPSLLPHSQALNSSLPRTHALPHTSPHTFPHAWNTASKTLTGCQTEFCPALQSSGQPLALPRLATDPLVFSLGALPCFTLTR